MRKKILIYLSIIFISFTFGVLVSVQQIRNTVTELNSIINLYQVEQLRRLLLINLHEVQTDLYNVNTVFQSDMGKIVDRVNHAESTAQECTSCHHPPELNTRIINLQTLIRDYQDRISFYITSSADASRMLRMKSEAAVVGDKIIDETENMSHGASQNLQLLTQKSTDKIRAVSMFLFATIAVSIFFGIMAALRLTKFLSRPIENLLSATRMIASGKLGTTVQYEQKNEFGELAENFNAMSVGLKQSYDELQKEILQRIKTSEELRSSRERFALAADGSNDGLWDVDLRSNVTYFSQRWKNMIGYREDEIGSSINEWFDRIHPQERLQIRADLNAHIDGLHAQFQSEFRILHKDGSYRWVLARGLAVRDMETKKAYRIAGSQTDITERKLTEEQLLYDAFHDSLTGMPNRALFMDRLTHAIKRSTRSEKKMFAVLFIDIDRFKIINDSLGHAIGDQLLIRLGRKLNESLRPGDTIARFGGDEFAVLLEDIRDIETVLTMVNRIQELLSKPIILVSGQEIYSTISIGICLGSDSTVNPEDMLRNADIAMYHAKSNGRARYEIFNDSMYEHVMASMKLETDLRKAMDNNEFLLHYQPVMSLKADRITGFEALVRWQHPVQGIIMPSDFIPLAEETGLIVRIGEWVISEACRQLREWQDDFPQRDPLAVSVNISGKQLLPVLLDHVESAVSSSGIERGTLTLEITETVLMENAERLSALLLKLKALDVKLQIDDFGTGYSSLSYLHSFPMDALKIDRSFVSKIDAGDHNIEIVRTIANLASSLKMHVIAEGVETMKQLERLRFLECENIQGFLLSRPLSSSAIRSFLRNKEWKLIHQFQGMGLPED